MVFHMRRTRDNQAKSRPSRFNNVQDCQETAKLVKRAEGTRSPSVAHGTLAAAHTKIGEWKKP
eukprot:3405000-Rhodomonas_salina.1